MENKPLITNIDWSFILQTIQDEKCILFIGPEAFSCVNNTFHLDEALAKYLDVPNNPDIQTYYKEDNLFLFTSRARKTKTYYHIKNFYQQSFSDAELLYEKIAEIPFHCIITLTPDKKINEVFDRLGVRHYHSFFWMKKPPDPYFKTPHINNPVIYSMLGSIDNQESIVLTHNDLFNYFESVFSGNSIPEKLKKTLKEADNFIFLGVPFEKWYMQLLLRILYIHNDYDFVRYASNQSVSEETKTFCLEQFKIEFIPKKIYDFINELYNQCQNAKMLRPLGGSEVSEEDSIEKMLTWLSKDRIDDVVQELRRYLESYGESSQELQEDLILISSRYSRLNKRILQGIIDQEEANIQANRIRKDLIDILKEAKQLQLE